MNSNISETYASALFSIYLESDKNNFFEDLKTLKTIFKRNRKLIKLLYSPMLPKTERKAIIDTIFINKINKMLVNFLYVLIDNNNFYEITGILKNALRKIDEEKGICFAVIETPFPLEKEEIEKIKKAIERRKKSQVEIDVLVNKSLIGGLRITLGNEVIDGSIKHRLEQIKKGVKDLEKGA